MIKKVDLHFYHGFLGGPQDWDQVLQNLTGDYSIWRNDLVKTFFQSFKGLKTGESYLERWAQCESLLWGEKRNQRVLVGYSLGGRLLMHIDPTKYDAVVLLASHPGLKRGREERLGTDQRTSDKMLSTDWDEWLSEWNSQDIFKNDIHRPDRMDQQENKSHWASILNACSLGKQNVKDGFLHENKEKIVWVCGGKDPKYFGLKSRMEDLLGEERVISLEGAGHGLPFESPKRVAEIVERVISSVE